MIKTHREAGQVKTAAGLLQLQLLQTNQRFQGLLLAAKEETKFTADLNMAKFKSASLQQLQAGWESADLFRRGSNPGSSAERDLKMGAGFNISWEEHSLHRREEL